jgi:hypothetical protein
MLGAACRLLNLHECGAEVTCGPLLAALSRWRLALYALYHPHKSRPPAGCLDNIVWHQCRVLVPCCVVEHHVGAACQPPLAVQRWLLWAALVVTVLHFEHRHTEWVQRLLQMSYSSAGTCLPCPWVQLLATCRLQLLGSTHACALSSKQRRVRYCSCAACRGSCQSA